MTPLHFDIVIWLGIILTAFPAVVLFYLRKKKTNWHELHKTFSRLFAILFSLASLTLIYGSFIEPRIIVLNPETIDLPKISKPIRAVVIADYQVGPYKKTDFVDQSVDRILALQPDIVFIIGDLIDNSYTTEDETIYLTPLARLASTVPTYAVHGNHEYGIPGGKSISNPAFRFTDRSQHTAEVMRELGVQYLINELEEISVNGESFYLFGGDEWWNGTLDFSSLEKRTKNIPTIALIHNPAATQEVAKHDIDLMLSGHTHGGQIRLPFIGPIGRIGDVPNKNWYQGWYTYEDLHVFVTSGIGESGVRARLFNPPEIVVLEIQ